MSRALTIEAGAELRTGLPPAALWFLGAVVVLLSMGLVLLFSASFWSGWRLTADPTYHLQRQLLGVLLGTGALVLAVVVPVHTWLRGAPLFASGLVLLLVLVLLFGVDRNGARRWFAMPLIGSLQPSELGKVIVPLLVAWGYQRLGLLEGGRARWGLREHLLPLSVLAIAILIVLEPDYGTGLFVLGVAGVMFLVGGMPRATVRISGLVVLAAGVAMFLARQDLVMRRLQALSSPRDQFQVDQSLLGIQGGGWFGSGLGMGLQKAMVPEQHTDFIVAVLGEELGAVGMLALLVVLTVVLQSGARMVRGCQDPALRLVALGLVVNIVLQSCTNIAVATASAPTKGIPLPFLSYGSSGLTVMLFEVGLLLGIARTQPPPTMPRGQLQTTSRSRNQET